MSYLLDTNVVSELRRGARANAGVVAWFDEQPASAMYLSVISLGEIRQGIVRLLQRDAARAAHLNRWVAGLVQFYEDRLLYIDGTVADEWGRLMSRRSVPVVDALIAATARVHRMTVVTGNARDFSSFEVLVLDPFSR